MKALAILLTGIFLNISTVLFPVRNNISLVGEWTLEKTLLKGAPDTNINNRKEVLFVFDKIELREDGSFRAMSQEEKDALTGDWTTSEKNELTLSNISVNKKIQSAKELSFLFKIKKKTSLMVLQYKVAAPQTSEYDFLILEGRFQRQN